VRRYCVDACHPVWGLDLVYYCWLLVGQRLFVGMGDGRQRLNRTFPDGPPLAARLRRQRLKLAPRRCDRKDFLQKALPLPAPSRPEPTARDAPPWLIRRNRPARRTADARGRRSHRFVHHCAPQPEAFASRSRPIHSGIAANCWRLPWPCSGAAAGRGGLAAGAAGRRAGPAPRRVPAAVRRGCARREGVAEKDRAWVPGR